MDRAYFWPHPSGMLGVVRSETALKLPTKEGSETAVEVSAVCLCEGCDVNIDLLTNLQKFCKNASKIFVHLMISNQPVQI